MRPGFSVTYRVWSPVRTAIAVGRSSPSANRVSLRSTAARSAAVVVVVVAPVELLVPLVVVVVPAPVESSRDEHPAATSPAAARTTSEVTRCFCMPCSYVKRLAEGKLV